jgi:hypothetical protein
MFIGSGITMENHGHELVKPWAMMYIGLSMVKRASEKLSKSNLFFPLVLFLMAKLLFHNIPKYIQNGIP